MNEPRHIRLRGQCRVVRAVAFDLDSTLTRPYLDFARLRSELGLPDGDILQWLRTLSSERRARAVELIDAFEQDGVRNVEWNDGAPETLGAVHALGLPVAIVSRNSRMSLRAVCRRLGISVELLVGREDAPPKPHPAGLLLVGNRFSVSPDAVLMIGDYRHDTEAGRAAGTMTVLLTNGKVPSWPIEADLVIERLPELLAYLT